MKIFLIFTIIACSTYIGYGFSSYYRQRLRFFKDIKDFASKLILEINFSKKNLQEIVQGNIVSYGSDFKKVLECFLNYLKDVNFEMSNSEMFFKKSVLTGDEQELVLMFFKALGKYDLFNQIKEIENYKSKFEASIESADAENKKYGGLYVKLGLLGGILIGILLI
ncbi:MAG: hypothetical protein J5779_02460 [Clostridia bacterium]|nr:hypothetical protein [Clostridia bacterium]